MQRAIGANATFDGSRHAERHLAQARHRNCHAVAAGEPFGLDQAAGEDDFPCPEIRAGLGQAVGKPGERVERMAHDVAALPATDLAAVDFGRPDKGGGVCQRPAPAPAARGRRRRQNSRRQSASRHRSSASRHSGRRRSRSPPCRRQPPARRSRAREGRPARRKIAGRAGRRSRTRSRPGSSRHRRARRRSDERRRQRGRPGKDATGRDSPALPWSCSRSCNRCANRCASAPGAHAGPPGSRSSRRDRAAGSHPAERRAVVGPSRASTIAAAASAIRSAPLMPPPATPRSAPASWSEG